VVVVVVVVIVVVMRLVRVDVAEQAPALKHAVPVPLGQPGILHEEKRTEQNRREEKRRDGHTTTQNA
jgi:hypothetical protein